MANHGSITRVVLHFEDGFVERVSVQEARQKLHAPHERAIPEANLDLRANAETPYYALLFDEESGSLVHTTAPQRVWSDALDDALTWGEQNEAKRLEVWRWTRTGAKLADQRGSVRERARVRWHIVE